MTKGKIDTPHSIDITKKPSKDEVFIALPKEHTQEVVSFSYEERKQLIKAIQEEVNKK